MLFKHLTKLSYGSDSVAILRRFVCAQFNVLDKCQQTNRVYNLHKRKGLKGRTYVHNQLRKFSCSTLDTSNDAVVESLEYDVEKFGKLVFRSPMDVHIEPLNPQDYPENNKLFVNIRYKSNNNTTTTNNNNNGSFVNHAKRYSVIVDLEHLPEEIVVMVSTKEDARKLQLECHIQVPMKYDVEVICEKHGSSWLQKLENSKVHVRCEDGSCTCRSVKSGTIKISTAGGNIISESVLQGNLHLSTTAKGFISTSRLQGQTIDCRTDTGKITIKDVYADRSSFKTEEGDISIQNCHGNSKVSIENANLKIGSLDGNLSAKLKSGHADVFIAKEGNVNLVNEKGDISIKVASSVNSALSLSAHTINSSVDIHGQTTNEGGDQTEVEGRLKKDAVQSDASITAAAAQGQITLAYQDWFSSLNFGKGFD